MKKSSYNLNLNNFSGPIDLLLTLVREKKIDILNINLLDLANEYIKIIENLKNNDINLAVEYLVMASSLLKLKTYALLAVPKSNKSINNAEANILEKLIKIQQFKNIAKILRMKEIARKNIFIKIKSPVKEFECEVSETNLNGFSNTTNIIINLKKMFERVNKLNIKHLKIKKFNFSPEERREQLLKLFKSKNNITFKDIFSVPTINHFLVTVITVLDMAKKQEIIIEQKNQFDTIFFKKRNY